MYRHTWIYHQAKQRESIVFYANLQRIIIILAILASAPATLEKISLKPDIVGSFKKSIYTIVYFQGQSGYTYFY